MLRGSQMFAKLMRQGMTTLVGDVVLLAILLFLHKNSARLSALGA